MTREDYVQICKVCKNHEFDPKKGIVCSLTKEIAAFQNTCEQYEFKAEEKKLDMDRYVHMKNSEDNGQAQKDIIIGALFLVGGLFASTMGNYVFIGAVVYGGFKLFTGLSSLGN